MTYVQSRPARMDEQLTVQLSGGDLRCAICHEVFLQPVHAPCGHTFCRACLLRWMQQSNSCPDCRAHFPLVFDAAFVSELSPDLLLAELVRQRFFVTCPDGCSARVHPAQLEDHRRSCEAVLVACENRQHGCNELVRRDGLLRHLQSCEHFCCDAAVLGCGFRGSLQALRGHKADCAACKIKEYIDSRTSLARRCGRTLAYNPLFNPVAQATGQQPGSARIPLWQAAITTLRPPQTLPMPALPGGGVPALTPPSTSTLDIGRRQLGDLETLAANINNMIGRHGTASGD